MMSTLYYAHDPMCSWCWAFRPTWDQVYRALPDGVALVRLAGGLAPDSDDPMPEAQQRQIQQIWRSIEKHVPGTRFNFDFWTQCRPRRSTYPACRAVIAAARQDESRYETMVEAIQHAYYLDARNPSDEDTLVALAGEAGLDKEGFRRDLASDAVRAEFRKQVETCYTLGIQGFPALVIRTGNVARRVPVEFNDPQLQLELIADAAGIAA